MADRAKALVRLATVQKQIVRLSEWRLAHAEQACRELSENQLRLQRYVVEEGALGVPLAKAALRSLHGLDRRIADAESRRAASRTLLETAKQREQAVDALSDRVGRLAQRKAEDRALGEVVEAWLAGKGTSLP